MKENTSQFIPGAGLIADIGCLFQFLSQPIPLDAFFKKFPTNILNAKLSELEFEEKTYEETEYFVIKFKATDNTDKIELTNDDLSSFGLSITDSARFINPLIKRKKDSPKFYLESALTKLIIKINANDKKTIVNGILNNLKDTVAAHPDNRNKLLKIDDFFSFIKKLIIKGRYPDLNTDISELQTSLDKSAIKDLSTSKIFIAYEKLLYKITLILPEPLKGDESALHSLIDTLIRTKANSKTIISNYEFFKLSYFGKQGFRFLFGGDHNLKFYESIKTNSECFHSFKKQYLEILNLTQELYFLSDYNQEVINLYIQLNCSINDYFQTILDISSSNANEDKKSISADFQESVKKNIKEFREKKYTECRPN